MHTEHITANHASVSFIAAAALLLMSTTASADVMIVQSTAKGLSAGTTLKDSAPITIPAGKKATFILPSGATRTIAGPFKGKAAELTKGVKSNPGIWNAIKRYVVTGGSTSKRVGAMRSVAPSSFARPLPFSWSSVPVTTRGDYCLERGATVLLTRRRANQPQTFTLLDLKSKRRSEIAFEKGESSKPWPEDIDLASGATYGILTKGWPVRRIRLRMISPLPPREDTLQVLHGQRCESQFRAFIQQIKSTG